MKNISVAKYNKAKNKLQYNMLLEAIKPEDTFLNGFSLDKLSYNEVRAIQKLFTTVKTMEDMMRIFTTAYQCKDYLFWNMKIVNYFQTKAFLIEKFVSLNALEIKLLESFNKDTALRKASTGEKLNEFANIMPLDALSKVYGGYPLDYGLKPYTEVIYLLRMNNKINECDRDFNRLKYGK